MKKQSAQVEGGCRCLSANSERWLQLDASNLPRKHGERASNSSLSSSLPQCCEWARLHENSNSPSPMIRWFPVLLLISSVLFACGTPQPHTPAAVVARAEQKRPTHLVDKLTLSAVQRTQTNAIVKRVRADLADYEVTRVALLAEAVAQVRAGELNRKRLEPLAQDAIAKVQAALPKVALEVNAFHRLLTPAQREEFIDLLQGDNLKLTDEQKRERRNERIAKVLDLTSGQKTQIYAALFAVMLKHWSAVDGTRDDLDDAFDAFLEPDFDARELKITQEIAWEGLAEAAFEALEVGMNHLNPAQQKTLAAWMEVQGR